MKRLRQLGLAAVLLSFALPSQVASQNRVNDNNSAVKERLGPSFGPAERNPNLYVSPGGGIFPQGASGLSYSAAPLSEPDGAPARRQGLIGSWEVEENVNLGLGLFSVSRYSHHKPENFTRQQPMRDVRGSSERIAAIGMSFRF